MSLSFETRCDVCRISLGVSFVFDGSRKIMTLQIEPCPLCLEAANNKGRKAAKDEA